MKLLTAEDLLSLEYGDKVYYRNEQSSFVSTFRYVGRMPSSKRYLIFSEGELLKHLYIYNDNTFKGEWYGGEYDDDFIIKVRIEELKKELSFLTSELKEDQITDESINLIEKFNKNATFDIETESILNQTEYNKMIELGSNIIKFDNTNGIGVSIKCLLENGEWKDITDYSKW